MIRLATPADIDNIAASYEELLIHEEQTTSYSRWKRGVYPSRAVPESKIAAGSMYVLEDNGEFCASVVLNQLQAPEYAAVEWLYPAADHEVLVIHTLCVPPSKSGRGYAKQLLAFARQLALEWGCTVIRMDTHVANTPAQQLYLKHGYRISGRSEVLLNGQILQDLYFLELKL